MILCKHDGCQKMAETGSDECFRHRVMSVGISWSGGARPGRRSWNVSKNDWLLENLGTTDDRELAKRGIERAGKI